MKQGKVLTLHPRGEMRCGMRDLPRGDCSQAREVTPGGIRLEFCYYHNKIVKGLLAPIRPDAYNTYADRFEKKEALSGL